MSENKNSKSDSLPKRTMTAVKVIGAEKRYKPTKHYVFIIQVTYTDDTEYVIYRRYSDFFDFHTTLLDQFPIEAGDMKEPRIIPYLPGRKPFARDKKKLADKRQGDLNDYCQDLIKLKDAVSKCKLVREFFEVKHADLNSSDEAREKPKKTKLKLFGKDESAQKQEGVMELCFSSFYFEGLGTNILTEIIVKGQTNNTQATFGFNRPLEF